MTKHERVEDSYVRAQHVPKDSKQDAYRRQRRMKGGGNDGADAAPPTLACEPTARKKIGALSNRRTTSMLTAWRSTAGISLAETTRTSVSDPRLLLGGPALLLMLALIACYLPARRSTRIDPIRALRAE